MLRMERIGVTEDDNGEEIDGLVDRSRRGDMAAFERLYRATCGRVHAVCLRMSGSRAAAEDLTQETYIRAWKGLAAFRGESSFATWIHTIAVRTSVDAARWERRRELTLAPRHSLMSVAAPSSLRPETSIGLERAIAALPAGARHVLVLHDIFGYGHREIAALLGISVGTTKSQLNRARQLVAKEISDARTSD